MAGRHLSFTLAAEELKFSQAAVSQQMRQLEAYLGNALFVRHNRRLSLTNSGQAYLDTVLEALDRLDAITDQLFPDQHSRTVTLRCTSGIATLWLAPQLKSLQQLHPDIELRIRTLDNSNDPLSASELEIFIAGENKIDTNTRKLLTATITPVCSPVIFTKRQRPTKPADLFDLELIHVLGYDDDWHRWFRKHQQGKVAVPGGLSVDGSLIAIEAALRGDGIMLGRQPFINRYLESGDLVEVFSSPLHLYSDYYLRQLPEAMTRRENKIVAHWLGQLASR